MTHIAFRQTEWHIKVHSSLKYKYSPILSLRVFILDFMLICYRQNSDVGQ
jgi:hypothetical protein